MINYVPINNTILRDIVRCFNPIWSGLFDAPYGPGGGGGGGTYAPPPLISKSTNSILMTFTPHFTKIVLIIYLQFVLKSD